MGKILDAINDFLFPVIEPDGSTPDVSATVPNRFIPPRNDHAYYVNRLETRILAAQRAEKRSKQAERDAYYASRGITNDYDDDDDYYHPRSYDKPELRDHLVKLQLSTLSMMDEHHRLIDLDEKQCESDEDILRSTLLISAQPDNQQHRWSAIQHAITALRTNHNIRHGDLTKAPAKQAALIGAACNFIIQTNLYQTAPPRLTEFVMERPDRTDDILTYMKTFEVGREQVHNIDLVHVAQFLDSPSQSLREGEL